MSYAYAIRRAVAGVVAGSWFGAAASPALAGDLANRANGDLSVYFSSVFPNVGSVPVPGSVLMTVTVLVGVGYFVAWRHSRH